MVGKRNSTILIFCLCASHSFAQKFSYLQYVPKHNIEVSEVIDLYNLTGSDVDSLIINNKISPDQGLAKNRTYRMPIRIYNFNGKSIRTSIGITNYSQALSIKHYNAWAEQNGYKSAKEHKVWVPISFLNDGRKMDENGVSKFIPYTFTFSLFGKDYEKVDVVDNTLKDYVYYLVSGHGGPDPGANCQKEGHFLCEDEYAYDIILRLAKNLMSHEAKVYIIVQDKNDGIREEMYLELDHDEIVYGDIEIPLNQIKRLKQRTDIINNLYKKNKGKYKQRFIELHVDSRHEDKKIDLFFYHYPGSEVSKKISETLLETMKAKYNEHQSSRGYDGLVKERDLFSLRETYPYSVYIEIGNITNEFDQKRILIPNNRQAIANWLTEGLMK